MKKIIRKALSMLLAVIMVFTVIPLTGTYLEASAAAKYMWPVVGNYSVSRWNNSEHHGVDITNSGNVQNPQIISTYSGTVTQVSNVCPCTGKDYPYYDTKGNYIGMVTCLDHRDTYGNLVKVLNDDGTTSVYGHLKYDSICVKVGDRVSQGQILGLMGDSGVSTGIHLHFEIRSGTSQSSCIDLKNTSFLPANIFVNYTSPPTDGWLWVEKEVAGVGEDIRLNFNATDASRFVIGIWKDNKEYAIIDNGYNDWYTINFSESGIYSVHVACYNNLGHCDSNYINIFVYGNLGNDFCGIILNSKTWRPIAVDENSYISLQKESGNAEQVWNFTRQTDGSYVITSALNGKVLEFYYGSNSVNPVFTSSFDGGYDYQRWYICPAFGGFCLLSKQDVNKNLVLDLENQSSDYGTHLIAAQFNCSESQVLAIYNQQEVQLKSPQIEVQGNTSGKETTFIWDDVYGEYEYNLRIYKDGVEYKSVYLSDNLYEIMLPSGEYTAFVRALNYFTYTQSDTISFSVGEAATYNVSYNSNGGSNAPSAQTKTYGTDLTLSTAISTKANYNFIGWNTKADGTGTTYQPGDTYTENADLTLYAMWELAHTHSYTSSVTKQPTCTEKGIRKYTCSSCGDTYTEDIAALGHNHIGSVTEPTCTEQGFTTYTCSRCDNSYNTSFTDPLNHPTSSWYTAINPTASSDGLAEKRCDHCGKVLEQFIIPSLVPDYVTGVSLSSEKETVKVGSTFTLKATVTPDTAKNKNVIWSSRNPEIATVVNGKVTAVKPGTTAIVATTEDGGYVAFCLVRVLSLSAINGAVVNNDSNIVYGLSCNLNSVDDYLEPADDSMSIVLSDSVVGTGTTISVIENGEVVDSYTAVIFGDIDGNGWYDANDAFLVRMLEVGLLTSEAVGEAAYRAADCNHDGVVDGLDVQLLERASILLDNVNQSATQAELSLDSVYIEYCSVIDQSAGFIVEDNATVETQPEPETKLDIVAIFSYIFSLFEKIFAFVISIIG
ncbi:MAG: peptidoglycan DD-metalloendopeptidase family protein [Clostridia bacterium]|nr:peptidoglycan DD-metalloendopeptidase family protein [Clostridia bacterium]